MPHQGLVSLLAQSSSVINVQEHVSQGRVPVLLYGAQGYARYAYAAAIHATLKKSTVLVVPRPEEAVVASRNLSDLLGSDKVLLYPAREVMPFEVSASSEPLWMRLKCMEKAISDKQVFFVMPATALLPRVIAPTSFEKHAITLEVGQSVDVGEMIRRLVESGYTRESVVELPGQIAARGGIVDVFPPSLDSPIRLEFFDQELESIREFDVDSQASIRRVTRVIIGPASDYLETEDEKQQAFSILDYLPDLVLVVEDYSRCVEALDEFESVAHEIASARLLAGTMQPKDASRYVETARVRAWLSRSSVMFSGVLRSYEDVRLASMVEAETSVQVGFAGRWDDLLQELHELRSRKRRVVLLAGNLERQSLLFSWLSRHDFPVRTVPTIEEVPAEGEVILSVGTSENGFNLETLNLSVFTESEIYGRAKVKQKRRSRPARAPLDFRELKPGDYVVHANHGIGQFMGIKTMTVNGASRDYLHLRYAGTDALYVPVDQVGLIEKYVGPQDTPPPLQRLGTAEWQRIKSRVTKSIEDMARKLLMLEAKRKSRKGHAFSPDTPWQIQFEEAFEYEDTEDQVQATREIKTDMEKPTPMDRLLCGDVGFGKTEVAMRCAFKAVMDNKQVAVLVPTTILAEQHYNTFTRRFADYPVTIRVLSRFRPEPEQRKIVKDLALGAVDIIIGTHRLLSKDIKFHDLGLLIIDEEHRFGVAQKERLKQLSETCDVLTLTATPIPRTLNMALSGIRDVSVIETPPEGRFPVETYVVPYNPSVIAQAIRREMKRGGQVFYVHNRVYSIWRVYQRVQDLVPEARIAVAHGQMKEDDLYRTMEGFLQGQFDVLIATTIIESGLDLPNVNTLIVEDADKLGLAQLYQLRGRVGRSNKIAYAYFTYRHDKNLTIQAEQRLNALRDFAAMGSGFKLAMRDLEIRGAGNLLGPEQHGFMSQVGYDMYVRLLEKAVRALKGIRDTQEERIITSVEIPCDAYIPSTYIADQRERFAFYKRIAGANDDLALEDVEYQMSDRFGALPEPVMNLLDIAKLRITAGRLGVTTVSLMKEDMITGKDKLVFKVEVPGLFPAQKLTGKGVLEGLDYNARTGVMTLVVPCNDPEGALQRALSVVRALSEDE